MATAIAADAHPVFLVSLSLYGCARFADILVQGVRYSTPQKLGQGLRWKRPPAPGRGMSGSAPSLLESIGNTPVKIAWDAKC